MKIVKPALLFCLLVFPLSAQSTYFLDFIWDEEGIALQNSEKVKVKVKEHRRSYLSEQTIYFEFTKNGQQVYWSSLPHPRRVHVEHADENGNLHRQESNLKSAEFTIRIPAEFQADKISFFTVSPNTRGRIQKDAPLLGQAALTLIEEISFSLRPE